MDSKQFQNLLYCSEKPMKKKNEHIFQRSSFESNLNRKIVDQAQNERRKQKKLIGDINKNDKNDDSREDIRDVGNLVETDKNGNSNNMKDYNKYSLFNTAPACASHISLTLFLTYHVIKI